MTTGKIIILNGASSAGKTTVANAIREISPEPFWHISFDQFVAAEMLPERHEAGPFAWWEVTRPRVFDALHGCVAAIAEAGNNVIVEHVFEFDRWIRDLAAILENLDVFLVGVHCPLEELERRERLRGDRKTGEGREHLRVVHSHGRYDFEIDTYVNSPEENARLIVDAWMSRGKPSAFDELRETFASESNDGHGHP